MSRPFKQYTPRQLRKLQREWTKKIGIPEEPVTEASFRRSKINNEQINIDKQIYFNKASDFLHNLAVTKKKLPVTYHHDLFHSDETDFSRVLVSQEDYNTWKLHSEGVPIRQIANELGSTRNIVDTTIKNLRNLMKKHQPKPEPGYPLFYDKSVEILEDFVSVNSENLRGSFPQRFETW